MSELLAVGTRCIECDGRTNGSISGLCSKCSLEAYRTAHYIPPLNLTLAIESAARRPTEAEILPLLLFKGNLGFGRAQALYSFIASTVEAPLPSLTPAILSKLSVEQEDFRHIPGIHSKRIQVGSFYGFLGRLLAHSHVMDKTPRMRAYVRELARNSPWIYDLEPIARWSPWSKAYWRNPREKDRSLYSHAIGELKTRMPEVWPFVNEGERNEHAILAAIDAVVPRTIPENFRQDICQDLAVAILTGETSITDLVTDAPHFIRAVFKQYPIKWGPLSIDMPVPWMAASSNPVLLRDTLVSGGL